MKVFLQLFLLLFLISSCGGDTLPKQKPYLKLTYPIASYETLETTCPYSFETSTEAIVKYNENCWAKIEYPRQKAILHITYREVNNNLNEILKEVEKLTFEHTIKADVISDRSYDNVEKKVYVKMYNVEGNVATNIQFRATDSVKHVLAGALYFHVKPNYDSILPAIKYIEKDMIHLIETLDWK